MKSRWLPFVCSLLSVFSFSSATAQINTDRMMDVGRNALYFDDYALSIQYFNRVILAKPYLHEPYFFRGLAKFYLEDYVGAESDCSNAIELNPYYPNSYELRGLSRINLGKFLLAEQDYKKAAEVQPESKAVWHNWVLCNIELDSMMRADSIADRIIRKWPKHADGYVMKAEIGLGLKDTLAAERWIDTALVADRYHVPSLSMKASFQMSREEWTLADSTLTEAIRLQPKNAHNLINRALCKYHLKLLRQAMEDYDLALDIDPTNFAGHYNRGLLRASVGEDNLAIEDFNFILRIDSTDVMAIYNRAELLMETGDFHGAIRDYSTLIRTYPNFLQGYLQRAQAKRKLGDQRGASKDEEHVLREQIAHRYGYQSQASRTATTRKKSEVNLADYQKLVVDDSSDEKQYESEYRGKIQNKDSELKLLPPTSVHEIYLAESHDYSDFNRALEHLLVEEYEPAIRLLNQFIEKYPDVPEAYYNRAYAYAKTKQNNRAIENLDKAIECRNNYSQAYFNRGILCILSGQNEQAANDLSKAGELGIFVAYSVIKHYGKGK